jgi:hypothetical protein
MNIFDINVRGQSNKACQERVFVINTRDTRCIEDGTCQNLSLKLVRCSGSSCLKTAGDAANTLGLYANVCSIERQAEVANEPRTSENVTFSGTESSSLYFCSNDLLHSTVE